MLPLIASAAGSLFSGIGQGISGAMAEDSKMPESGKGGAFISGPFTVGSKAIGRGSASGDTSASQEATAAAGEGLPVGASQAAAAGNTWTYVALGVAGLAVALAFVAALKR